LNDAWCLFRLARPFAASLSVPFVEDGVQAQAEAASSEVATMAFVKCMGSAVAKRLGVSVKTVRRAMGGSASRPSVRRKLMHIYDTVAQGRGLHESTHCSVPLRSATGHEAVYHSIKTCGATGRSEKAAGLGASLQ
jgi:hypothetical protein